LFYTGRENGIAEREELALYGPKPFAVQTESDWHDRFHQYTTYYNDRGVSPINFKDQLGGRRQPGQTKTAGTTELRGDPLLPWTLKVRAARLPLDRNCYREGSIAPSWAGPPEGASLYQKEATWDCHNCGGGERGSSDNFDYDNEKYNYTGSQRNFVDPRWTYEDTWPESGKTTGGRKIPYHYSR
jgi:hypothetical protein